MSTKNRAEQKVTFEKALEQLEAVLMKLERSDCPLEESLALFQEGMGLVVLCRGKLSDVENKISILLKDSAEFIPFAGEGERL